MSFRPSFTPVLTFFASILFTGLVHAHDYTVAQLRIGHPWARATVPGQVSAGAFLSIDNKGRDDDRLIAVASPVSRSAEIHDMRMEGNVMKMREVGGIAIKPAEKITMQPGKGYHIMLIGLSQVLKAGDRIPMTLRFEKAGVLEVSVQIEDRSAVKGGDGMEHH